MTINQTSTSPVATQADEQPRVVIIGGGIGGLAAAVSLTRQGIHVDLYERTHEFGEVGAGLQIAPNCTRILDDLGLLDEVKRLGVLPKAMVGKDGLTGEELTRLDLLDVERRYGFPYMVIHRSDLHATFLRAAQAAGVNLVNDKLAVTFENTADGARVEFEDGTSVEAPIVIAADGLYSKARKLVVDDQPVSSAYVAYRGAVPIEQVASNDIDTESVVVYLGPDCHFVQYPLRAGEMFNQVAVFESPKAKAGQDDWGTPDELDAAFVEMCEPVQKGLPHMWRDRWWRMYDREPIMNWLAGNVVLLGDAAHPPLQYMAQGAIMAIEDGWVLGEHVKRNRTDDGGVDWPTVLAAYNAVRPEHCRRVLTTGREWGVLWHHTGEKRELRNVILKSRDTVDYSFTDWIWGPTALFPQDEPQMFTKIPLDSVRQPLGA